MSIQKADNMWHSGLIKIHYLNQFNYFISQFPKFFTILSLPIIYFVLQCRKMSSPFKLFVIALWSVTMATAKTLDDDECPDFSGMDNFSLYAFLGKWYEVERYPTARFENHTCIQIDYQQTSQNSTGGYTVVFWFYRNQILWTCLWIVGILWLNSRNVRQLRYNVKSTLPSVEL